MPNLFLTCPLLSFFCSAESDTCELYPYVEVYIIIELYVLLNCIEFVYL